MAHGKCSKTLVDKLIELQHYLEEEILIYVPTYDDADLLKPGISHSFGRLFPFLFSYK